MMKIAMVGVYPQPFGGVSIHIKRLSEMVDCIVLDESHLYNEIRNNKCVKPDYVKPSIFVTKHIKQVSLNELYICQLFTILKEYDLIHIHTYRSFKIEALRVMVTKLFGKKIISTIHAGNLIKDIENITRLQKWFLGKWFSMTDKIILVGKDQHLAVQCCFGNRFDDKIKVINAFLLPERKGTKTKSKKIRLLVMGTWLRLYGFDMVLRIMRKLKNAKLTILIHEYGSEDNGYKDEIMEIAKDLDISFVYGCVDMSKIYNQTDIFIRPTRIDGFGVSVAEALCFGIPAIASDVCERQDGCILFKNGDENELCLKLKNVINNYESEQERVKNLKIEDSRKELLELYV